MVNKKLFYLPVLGMAIVSFVGIVIFESVLTNWFQQYVKEDMDVTLNTGIMGIKSIDPGFTLENMDPWLDNIPLSDEKHRLTVIDSDGRVIGDSTLKLGEVQELGNYIEREEIAEALQTGYGHSQRESAVINAQTLYIAKRFEHEGFTGVMRIATTLSYIDTLLLELELLLGALMGTSVLAMLVLAIFTNRHIQTRILAEQNTQEHRIAERTREIELLQRLANMLAACSNVNEAQQVVEDVIPRILGQLNGAVSMIRSSRNQLEVKLDWGGVWPGAHSYAPGECWALRKGKSHLSNDKYTTLPCLHMSDVGLEQTLCIPLVAHGNAIGVMHLYLAGESTSSEWMQLAYTVAEHLGLALANLNLQEELREQAIRDPLTGLHNRRYLDETIAHALMSAHRHKRPLSILMLDMDHFKRFNDNFGHDAGDYVLKSLGSLLTKGVRGEDVVCRIGGEELAVLLPDTDVDAAGLVAEKLCTLVREMHLDFNGQSLGQLTLSVGYSTYPNDSSNSEELMKLADTALYKAKNNGRDQSCHAQSIKIEDNENCLDENEGSEGKNILLQSAG